MNHKQLESEVEEVIEDSRNIEKVKSITDICDWRDWRTSLAEEMANYEDAVSYYLFEVNDSDPGTSSLNECLREMQRAVEEIADEWHTKHIGTFDFSI
jgi:hypothetical protein